MLRIILLFLAITTFSLTANAAKTPIKLNSSAAFNQQAPTTSPYTPLSSNGNCPSMSGQTPNNNAVTPPSYAPYYYGSNANTPTTPTAANPSMANATTSSANGSILLSPPSGNQKSNQAWTIT
jgi:hypothetical protein